MLRARNGHGDAAHADALLVEAASTYETLGMHSFLERARAAHGQMAVARRTEATGTVLSAAAPAVANVFLKRGDFWTIAYAGSEVRLRNARGLEYVAHLLRHPMRDMHVLDLVSLSRLATETAASLGAAASGPRRTGATAAVLPDPRAKSAYRARLESLREQLDEAEGFNDVARATRLGEEIELLISELGGVYRPRAAPTANDPIERARKAVANRIRSTLQRLRREHPALTRHFDLTLRIGTFCSYRPEHPPRWELD
jgi:hypothetical protein